jgi:hypothetical protein
MAAGGDTQYQLKGWPSNSTTVFNGWCDWGADSSDSLREAALRLHCGGDHSVDVIVKRDAVMDDLYGGGRIDCLPMKR